MIVRMDSLYSICCSRQMGCCVISCNGDGAVGGGEGGGREGGGREGRVSSVHLYTVTHTFSKLRAHTHKNKYHSTERIPHD